MRVYSWVCLLILLPFFSALPSAAVVQKPILGVMEENPGIDAEESNSYGVRICFRKNKDDWQVYPNDCNNMECLKAIPAQFPIMTVNRSFYFQYLVTIAADICCTTITLKGMWHLNIHTIEINSRR
jgi:hypothetical protein